MTIIFRAKTHEGNKIKNLSELLQSNIKTACLEIRKDGIFICMMSTQRSKLIYTEILSDNCEVYTFNKDPFCISISAVHLTRSLRYTKKKDSVDLYIDDEDPMKLFCTIIPKENTRGVSTSHIKINYIQNIEVELPDGYSRPVIIPCSEYQKMCKDLKGYSSSMQITTCPPYIRFFCDAGGIYSKDMKFGELELDKKPTYCKDFDTDDLYSIIKISSLGTNLKIYTHDSLPLYFQTQLGSIGTVKIFIKDKEQIEHEACQESTL